MMMLDDGMAASLILVTMQYVTQHYPLASQHSIAKNSHANKLNFAQVPYIHTYILFIYPFMI